MLTNKLQAIWLTNKLQAIWLELLDVNKQIMARTTRC